jgi:hypothetical protein
MTRHMLCAGGFRSQGENVLDSGCFPLPSWVLDECETKRRKWNGPVGLRIISKAAQSTP